jgi:type VI secretion system protein ImpL
MTTMKKLLTHRWFLGGLGVLALVMLVWLVGDLVGFAGSYPLETRRARALAALVLVLAWLAYEAIRLLLQWRANRKLLDQMGTGAEDAGEQRSREEVAQLKARFEQATGVLARLRFKGAGGRQYLYQLPWYMFIGAPGSGKTTALTRSGLRFPLAESGDAEAVKGVGGTRNCDWWFTDEAVFLDTAGRYTTQDSDRKVDAAAWQGFLGLLAKFRPGSPLNGAIVTLSLADLLTQPEAQRIQYADAVRSRLAELYDTLGTRFPVYLLVTKADLLAGFTEYFAGLGSDERAQVWGVTFPFEQARVEGFDAAAAFRAGFAGLEQRLNAGLTDRLQAERDQQRRAAIFGFPQQVSLAGPLVEHFIGQAFLSSRFAQQPLLRGVYLASGTQEGTPFDRVLGTLARSLRLERKLVATPAASGKSYFLMGLLREVVFPEAGLAGFNAARARRNRWLLRTGFAAVAVLALALLAGWGVSYQRNQEQVRVAAARLQALQVQAAALPPAGARDLPQVLALLDAARALPWGYAERERAVPLALGFGLFQGDKLGEQANALYQRLLRDTLLAQVALRLEEQLRHPPGSEVQYEALKSYLMLYDDARLDPEAVAGWVGADWGPQLALVDGGAQRLAGHLRAALERRPLAMPSAPDRALIDSARRQLAAGSLPDRIYGRLKLLGAGPDAAPFQLSEAAGPAAVQVLQRASGEPLSAPFPALYTRAGYQKGFEVQAGKIVARMADEERWVLAGFARAGGDNGRLLDQVKTRYLEDYASQWDRLLGDIRLKRSLSLADTLLYARVLAAVDSPLRKLVQAASRETTLARDKDKDLAQQAQDVAAAAARNSVMEGARRSVNRVFGSAAPALPGTLPAAARAPAPELLVDQHFEPLRRLAGTGQGNAPIDGLLARLSDFYQELNAAAGSLQAGSVRMQGLASAASLKADAAGLPQPLAGIVRELVDTAARQLSGAGGREVSIGAQGASAFCDKAIRGRYPFVRSAQAEVTPEDFAAVFGPGGDLDQYFRATLAGRVDTSGAAWRARPGGAGEPAVSAATVRQFQDADAVRKAFFRGGQPAASAELLVVSSEAGAAVLDYDGEQSRLVPGQGAVRLKWPAQRPAAQARLALAGGSAPLLGEGSWALFRLFDRARAEPGATPERLRLHYLIDGRKLVLELRASSVLNPFRLDALERFQCPGHARGA